MPRRSSPTPSTEALDGPEVIYLSVDIDVIDPGMAPGTGTPEPGGHADPRAAARHPPDRRPRRAGRHGRRRGVAALRPCRGDGGRGPSVRARGDQRARRCGAGTRAASSAMPQLDVSQTSRRRLSPALSRRFVKVVTATGSPLRVAVSVYYPPAGRRPGTASSSSRRRRPGGCTGTRRCVPRGPVEDRVHLVAGVRIGEPDERGERRRARPAAFRAGRCTSSPRSSGRRAPRR